MGALQILLSAFLVLLRQYGKTWQGLTIKHFIQAKVKQFIVMKKQTLSGKPLPKNIYIEIIASLLIIYFAHSSISIAVHSGFTSLKNCLAFYTNFPIPLSSFLLGTEICITLLLLFPLTRVWGFAVSMLFAISIAWLCWAYPQYPHHFGGWFNEITHLQRWILLGSIFSLSFMTFIIQAFVSPWRRGKKEKRNVVYT